MILCNDHKTKTGTSATTYSKYELKDASSSKYGSFRMFMRKMGTTYYYHDDSVSGTYKRAFSFDTMGEYYPNNLSSGIDTVLLDKVLDNYFGTT